MAEDDTSAEIDTLVDEEAKETGLTATVIKDAVQREIAARAATRIVDKIEKLREGPQSATW